MIGYFSPPPLPFPLSVRTWGIYLQAQCRGHSDCAMEQQCPSSVYRSCPGSRTFK